MLEDMKMLTNDATILKIKHEVNYEVAKLAFDGTFEEKKDEIPFKMIPGLRPKFRCCVYKEREIIIMRFGLYDVKPMSLKEIGDQYGLTKERIRQIEKRAIEKMRMPNRYKLIESYKIA